MKNNLFFDAAITAIFLSIFIGWVVLGMWIGFTIVDKPTWLPIIGGVAYIYATSIFIELQTR